MLDNTYIKQNSNQNTNNNNYNSLNNYQNSLEAIVKDDNIILMPAYGQTIYPKPTPMNTQNNKYSVMKKEEKKDDSVGEAIFALLLPTHSLMAFASHIKDMQETVEDTFGNIATYNVNNVTNTPLNTTTANNKEPLLFDRVREERSKNEEDKKKRNSSIAPLGGSPSKKMVM